MRTLQIETVTLRDGSRTDVIRDTEAVDLLLEDLAAAKARIAELETELNLALDREAGTIEFCQAEMGWEFFRADFEIGKNPSKSLENAKKLREFLASRTAGATAIS